MPRYRFTPNGFGARVMWIDNVSKGRVRHYARWHDATFEVAGRQRTGARAVLRRVATHRVSLSAGR